MTNRPILATGHRPTTGDYYFGFAPPDEAAPLRGAGRRLLGLEIVIGYGVTVRDEPRRTVDVDATRYRYRILDVNEREILAYHWHPVGVSRISYPHLHLSGRLSPLDTGRGVEPVALGEMHLPTGAVTLANIVRLLITEFGVEPRRADWDAVLAANRDPFAPAD